MTHLPEVKRVNLVPLLNTLQCRLKEQQHSTCAGLGCRSGSESSNGSTDSAGTSSSSSSSSSPDHSVHMDATRESQADRLEREIREREKERERERGMPMLCLVLATDGVW